MAMHRIVRKVVFPLLIIAAVTFVLHATGASAYTHSQALNKAKKEQAWDCTFGNPFYKCITPWVFIACRPTGINQVAKPQYVCGGEFERVRRIRAKYQHCETLYFLSPWGAVLNRYRTYHCEDGIPTIPSQMSTRK